MLLILFFSSTSLKPIRIDIIIRRYLTFTIPSLRSTDMNVLNNISGKTFIKTTNILYFISSPWQKAEQMGKWNYKQMILFHYHHISHHMYCVRIYIKSKYIQRKCQNSYEIKYKRQKLLTSSVMSMISPIFSSSSSSFWGTYSNRTLHWRFLGSVMKTQQVTLWPDMLRQ